MIQIAPQMRILLAVEPVDFRNGIDGLAQICRGVLAEEPFSGTVFVFCNRRRTALKLLAYDGQGFWCCQNQPSSHYTSFDPRPASCSRLSGASTAAARSLSRSQRLECFVG